ncbi:MAG: GAF domain-containing sensor histidine kinase [Armatimonadota bacterium]|nr:GAF domain-containing sensor histidine kinase [Armatimonadota bacterium]MDR7520701.1 GAF domain-containing sensor histidine kinase [Armatimonadota bacterium]MDR7550218.1 GAF domain-containing sensor histidine kinase [Armatimonadota bacterium]
MERLVLVFFIYGLAFFAMGLAIALEARRASALVLSRPLRWLAAFGLLHAAVEWIDMWMIGPGAGVASPTLRILRLALFACSTAALAQFGADAIASTGRPLAAIRWLPLLLVVFWTLNWAVIPHLAPVPAGEVPRAPSCLQCHAAEFPPGSGAPFPALAPATVLADIWLRYLIYLPGSLLAAVAFWMVGRRLAGEDYPQIAQDCRWTAMAFAANAVMAGLVVPPAAFFPASVLNYDRFFAAVGVPPQLFRAGIAVLIAALVLRVLRVFEQEASRRLAAATEARLAAQQQALDAVEAAREAAEHWSRTLEERVAARTQELERRTRELAALNAIASTVTGSLDLQAILEATVDRLLDLVGADGGGIALRPSSPGGQAYRVFRGPAAVEAERLGGFEPGAVASGVIVFPEGGEGRPFLRVPLRAKDRLLGELVILGRPGAPYGDGEVALLSTVAQQVGVAVENARLFHETAARRREAETLYRLGVEITALSDVNRVLDLVTSSARDLLAADVAMLSLVDAAGRVVLGAASGLQTDGLVGVELPLGQGLAGQVVLTGQPLVVADYLIEARISHELDPIVRQEGLRTHVGVPVSARGRAIGCLAVAYRRLRPVTDDDVHLLSRMANQAAIAIENARLYEQVQSLAILEERDRLGREMHDSLGQSLGLLNLKVKLVEDLVSAGRTHEAQEELAQIRQTIREAYDEVRHAIMGLRISGAREDLEVALRVQVARFREQARLPVVYEVAGPIPTVPALAAVQITRIVQEALTNVRKHAEAKAVRVTLGVEDGRLAVRIVDDGRGFDVEATQKAAGARFGLETMRERAEGIGGTLTVTSAPGAGTTVALSVPVPEPASPARP